MRAELPWNVAGIPPEVREAARAAARREGLSVGEWLTRHILQSFSGLEGDGSRPLAEPSDPDDLTRDASPSNSGGISFRPQPGEPESEETWRRIEEQLRGIGRRLDSSERSQSESNRFLSRTAQEMNSNARGQAQVFDQLSQTVLGLRERLERLEGNVPGDNIRQAIKALHLGLSRLADQLTATTGNSTQQLMQVTANLEKLAVHVGRIRDDTDNAARLLHQRIDLAQGELAQRLDQTERNWGSRLAATEKTTKFNSNVLDHALEKIESAARERVADLAENQRRAALNEENLRELRDTLSDMEGRLPGLKLEARLNAIERSVGGLKETVGQQDRAPAFGAAVAQLTQRLDKLERGSVMPAEPPARAQESGTVATEEPGEAEAPTEISPGHDTPEYSVLRQEASEAEASTQQEPVESSSEPGSPVDIFLALQPQEFIRLGPEAENNDMIFPGSGDIAGRDATDEEFDIAFQNVFLEARRDEVLAEARRSAQVALERAESERIDRLSSFYESRAEVEDGAKRRYLIPVAAALLVAAAAMTTLVMSERAKKLGEQLAANPVTDKLPALPPLPQSARPSDLAAAGSQSPDNDQTAEIPPRSTSLFASNDTPTTETQNPIPDKDTPKSKSVALAAGDRVVLLANAGNPVALAILGLKALDGTGGTPIDLPAAIKFLTMAADKGQAVAQYRLGTLYERGQGLAADPVKAMHWYELAADQGNRKAMHNLAVAYASGPAAKRNMTEAARWFAKAAALGLADSQFNLAVLCERGDGVPQSLAQAYKWYAVAASSGDAEAKARMGVLDTQLSDSDKAEARKSAAAFHASPLIRSVNVPPEPADLGT